MGGMSQIDTALGVVYNRWQVNERPLAGLIPSNGYKHTGDKPGECSMKTKTVKIQVCPRCGKTSFGRCYCSPFWVWDVEDTPENGQTIYALDAEAAAERYAEKVDEEGEHHYASSEEGTFAVWPDAVHTDYALGLRDLPTPQTFHVNAEQVVNYWSDGDEPATPQMMTEWGLTATTDEEE